VSAQSHRSDLRVLNRRTLARDHRRLSEILRPGISVLDIGCGTGAITAGIARALAGGEVVGLDRDVDNLAVAEEHCAELPNLRFESGDVLSLPCRAQFDIVNAARTLQWVADPAAAIANMKRAAKPGGSVIALDYNHEDNRWDPSVPPEFARFYRAFLDWRSANGWDNRMAGHLPELFRAAGLESIQVHVSDEVTRRGDPDFTECAGIWTSVAQTVGPTIATAGFITEGEYLAAEAAYCDWVGSGLDRHTLFMRTVEGVVPCADDYVNH
jgi:SAM-dependent methyltransferase